MGVSDLDLHVRKSILVLDGRRRLVMRPAVMTPLTPMMPAVSTIVIMIIAAVAIIAAAGIVAVIWISVAVAAIAINRAVNRSEEHTSELQSLMRISYAVFCLKKKQ